MFFPELSIGEVCVLGNIKAALGHELCKKFLEVFCCCTKDKRLSKSTNIADPEITGVNTLNF